MTIRFRLSLICADLLSSSIAFGFTDSNVFIDVSSDSSHVVKISCLQPDKVDFEILGVNIDSVPFSISGKYPWRLTSQASGMIPNGCSVPYEVFNVNTLENLIPGDIFFRKLNLSVLESSLDVIKGGHPRQLHAQADEELGNLIWSSVPDGLTGTGEVLTVDPDSVEPGEYEVFVTSEKYPSATVSITVRVVSVSVSDETPDVFRNSDAWIDLIVIPESAYDDVSLEFEETPNPDQFSLCFDKSLRKIHWNDMIEESSLKTWANDQVAKVIAVTPEHIDVGVTKVKAKKRLSKLWDKLSNEVYKKLNAYSMPSVYFKDELKEQLRSESYIDGSGNE